MPVALTACGDDGGGGSTAPDDTPDNNDPGPDVDDGAMTFTRDVQPLLTQHCGSCHFDGGAAPFSLTTYEEVEALGPAIAQAIESGSMPPWSADDACRTYKAERRMSESEKATVLGWLNDGMAKGKPEDVREDLEAPSLMLDNVSVVTRAPEPYTANETRPDDYHCLVMDAEFESQKFLSALQIVPDVVPIVHHVVLYLVPPSGVEGMKQEDAESPEPGYTCFGSSGHGGQPMGVWVPGAVPQRFPKDSAFIIEPGSRVVAQMHYNTLAADAVPDHTELHLEFTDTAPRFRVTMPILAGALNIPAGDPASVTELSTTIPAGVTRQIVSVMPHMHVLGTSIDLRRERNGFETCLARVNDWDFNWQQFYDLKEDEFVDLRPGDTLRWTCTYDNSAANQPVVNGEQIEPRNVRFGEGTLDEMCVHFIALIEPYEGAEEGETCGGFDTCYEDCEEGDAVCFLSCGADSGESCGGCMLQGLNGCGQRECRAELNPVLSCLQGCDDIGTCLVEDCRTEYETFWTCIEPEILSGQCNTDFDECGLSF